VELDLEQAVAKLKKP